MGRKVVLLPQVDKKQRKTRPSHTSPRNLIWAVLSDEQMRKIWPFSLLNDEQMSNKVGVKHQPVIFFTNQVGHQSQFFTPRWLNLLSQWVNVTYITYMERMGTRWSQSHQFISRVTPPKTNMEPENGPLEKEIPIGNHHFQVPC